MRQTLISQPTLSDMPCLTSSQRYHHPSRAHLTHPLSAGTETRCSVSAVKAQVAEAQSDYWVKWIVTSGFRKRRVDFMQSRRALSPDAKGPSRCPPADRRQHESTDTELKDKHSRMAACLEVRDRVLLLYSTRRVSDGVHEVWFGTAWP